MSIGASKKALKRFLRQMFQNKDIVEMISYHLHSSNMFQEGASPSSRNVIQYADPVTVPALNASKVTNVFTQTFPMQTRRISYVVMVDDCPSGMSPRDKVTADGTLRQVQSIQNYLGVAYGLTLEGD